MGSAAHKVITKRHHARIPKSPDTAHSCTPHSPESGKARTGMGRRPSFTLSNTATINSRVSVPRPVSHGVTAPQTVSRRVTASRHGVQCRTTASADRDDPAGSSVCPYSAAQTADQVSTSGRGGCIRLGKAQGSADAPRPGARRGAAAGLGLGLGWAWAGLDWTGLDWTGLGWAGLGWAGLNWTGLGLGLGWVGLDWTGLDWTGLGWAGLGWVTRDREGYNDMR